MSLQSRVKHMLLNEPDPKKIMRGIEFILLKTALTPAGKFDLRAAKRFSLVLYNHARRFFKYPRKAVFTSLFAPVELIHAFDLNPFSLEVLAGVAASMNLAPELLAGTEKEWLSTDFCSFHRAYIEIARIGLLPAPAFALATAHTCDGTYKSFSEVSSLMSCPLIFLDTPYNSDRAAVDYLSGQLKKAAEQIEKVTGLAFNGEKLEQAFYFSNKARGALLEIHEIRRNERPLLFGEDSLPFLTVWGSLLGHREGAALFECYRDELRRRSEGGWSQIKGKKRILWLHLKPFFPNRLLRYIEQELGAVIVAEEINSVYWNELDARSPWESLALKTMSNFWVGGIEKRLDNIRRTIESHHIDGVIHFSHWGCRQSNGGVRLIKDTVSEYGIPFLNLDGDCVDERSYSEAQYLTRLEGFMELLE